MFKALKTRKKRRIVRKDIKTLKKIESILHPCPKIGAVEILHRHQGQKITFSAWVGNAPWNKYRFVSVDRATVLDTKDFYKAYWDEFVWLSENADESRKAS